MITAQSLTLIGKINKTHGIDGEMSVSFFDENVMEALAVGSCLVMDMDGIYTPFFVSSVRPRSAEALLLSFDTISRQEYAARYVGKQVYMLTDSLPETDPDNEDEDGFYATQLIGYQAYEDDGNIPSEDDGKCAGDANGKRIGEIIDIDDSTENVLFLVRSASGGIIYIPIVDEFITDINPANKSITFSLPSGLIQL